MRRTKPPKVSLPTPEELRTMCQPKVLLALAHQTEDPKMFLLEFRERVIEAQEILKSERLKSRK